MGGKMSNMNVAEMCIEPSILEEKCEQVVAIFPTRYTIKEYKKGMSDDVKHSYPELKKSKYTLRVLRGEGYVYIFDKSKVEFSVWIVHKDGQFQKMKMKVGDENKVALAVWKLEKGLQLQLEEIKPYIEVSAKSTEVYIGYSDALWTSTTINKAIDEASFRSILMTQVDAKGWSKDAPSEHSFDMEKIDTLIAEYKEPESWKKSFEWSNPSNNPESYGTKDTLLSIMKAEPRGVKIEEECQDGVRDVVKTIGIMLHDNIGLVEDLGSLMRKYQTERDILMTKGDKFHKKLVSNLVEFAFQREVEHTSKKSFSEFYEKEEMGWRWVKGVTENNSYVSPEYVMKYQLPYTHKYYSKEHKITNETEFKKRFFELYAGDKVKLINEEARQYFNERYEEELKELNQKVMEAKNDRNKHLLTLLKVDTNTQLGCSFLAYDKSYNMETETCEADKSAIVTSYQYGQSLASCVNGMMDEPKEVEGIKNNEHDTMQTFMEDVNISNGFWELFEWSRENKVDSLAAIIFGHDIKAWLRSREDGKVERHQHEFDTQNSKNSQEVANAKAKRFEYNKQLNEYSQTSVGKIIARHIFNLENSNKSVQTRTFNRLEASMNSNKNGYNLATFDKLADYKDAKSEIKIRKLKMNEETYKRVHLKSYVSDDNGVHVFNDLGKVSKGETAKSQKFIYVTVDDITYEALKKKVEDVENLTGKEKKVYKALEEDYKKIDKKIGEIKEHIDISQKVIESEEETRNSLLKEKQEKLDKSLAKWIGGTEKLLGGVMLIATTVNLYYALNAFKSKNSNTENSVALLNLIGAVAGSLTSAIATHDSFKTLTKPMIRLEGAVAKVPKLVLVKQTLKTKASILGIVAGFFDAITALGGVWIQYKDNNEKAKQAYLWAGVTLFAGALASIAIAPLSGFVLIGLIIVSVGATVFGIVKLFEAQDLAWDSMDKWLNSCYFRFVEVPGKTFIPNLTPFHDEVKKSTIPKKPYIFYYKTDKILEPANREKEITSFLKVLSTPKLKISWIAYYTGDLPVRGTRADDNRASIKIEVNFPFVIDKESFRYAISKSDAKESLHKLGEVSDYRWTTVSLDNGVFKLNIRHVTNVLREMFLTFSFKTATHGEERQVVFVYKIYRDNSYKLLEN